MKEVIHENIEDKKIRVLIVEDNIKAQRDAILWIINACGEDKDKILKELDTRKKTDSFEYSKEYEFIIWKFKVQIVDCLTQVFSYTKELRSTDEWKSKEEVVILLDGRFPNLHGQRIEKKCIEALQAIFSYIDIENMKVLPYSSESSCNEEIVEWMTSVCEFKKIKKDNILKPYGKSGEKVEEAFKKYLEENN